MPNAIWKLVHLLATMKNAAGQITIEGLCDQIIPPTDQERAAAAEFPVNLDRLREDLCLREFDAPADRPFTIG
jgi:hypothetical protein